MSHKNNDALNFLLKHKSITTNRDIVERDILTEVASELYDIPIDQVTSKHRADAKAVAFSFLYSPERLIED